MILSPDWAPNCVTRLGDFLHFGQPFKAGGNNYFTQIAHIVSQFIVKSFRATFIDIWGFLSGHTGAKQISTNYLLDDYHL